MQLKLGNIDTAGLSAKQKSNLSKTILSNIQKANSEKELDVILKKLQPKLCADFSLTSLSFPFYTYQKNNFNSTSEVLVDVIANDKYTWLENISDQTIPDFMKQIGKSLKEYNNTLDKANIGWDKGYYYSKKVNLKKYEENIFPNFVDDHFDKIKSLVAQVKPTQLIIDTLFLMGYAKKEENKAIKLLHKTLKSSDHSFHNMAARSLFPKAFIQKTEFIQLCSFLLKHRCFYCRNKYLGAIAMLEWTDSDKIFLQKLKPQIKSLVQDKQSVVSHPARMVLDKIDESSS